MSKNVHVQFSFVSHIEVVKADGRRRLSTVASQLYLLESRPDTSTTYA